AKATLVLPELHTADYDGDGKLDLFAVYEDVIHVHKGGGPTVFSINPVARHAIGPHAVEPGKDVHLYTSVLDLDGDGIADLAVNQLQGGLGSMQAQTTFYYGKRGGGYDAPAQVIHSEGFAGALAFADLDGDGKPDLLMPHFDVGFATLA